MSDYKIKGIKEDVLEIRRRYSEGNVTQQELADEYGVHFATVSLIIRRENWTWLEDKEV